MADRLDLQLNWDLQHLRAIDESHGAGICATANGYFPRQRLSAGRVVEPAQIY
jgi:hypothetical protein